MNNNYHFQKQLANEQIQAYLQDAENHRLSKLSGGRAPLSFLMQRAVPLLLGIAVVFFLLTGCTADNARGEAAADRPAAVAETTMAERIQFQDVRDIKFDYNRVDTTVAEISMADRIHFQDARDATLDYNVVDTSAAGSIMANRIVFQDARDSHLADDQAVAPAWTMAERIQFHDQLQK